MAFTRLTYERDWTKAEDFPTYESSEVQVRADMQYHPNAVKEFINTLLTTLEGQTAATSLGASDENGLATTMQSVLDTHAETLAHIQEEMDTMAGGGVPLSVQSVEVKFQKWSWFSMAGGATLTIAPSEHKRNRSAFGYTIYQLVDNTYRSGTWGAATTRVTYNPDGSITLATDQSYAGKIVFFGL